ncbi:unnamed protein product [Dracunculus medinensis]|uniref:Synaptonemal complex protein 1 n=1 Tax=Dracunculus medinensis TaxID=318479 RepID=A0A0N4U672_DRAME|nr:unnamed protein product [Dracunculus medinensis]
MNEVVPILLPIKLGPSRRNFPAINVKVPTSCSPLYSTTPFGEIRENLLMGPTRKPDIRTELESIGRCLKGEELVNALMERVLATEEEKATLLTKLQEHSNQENTWRKQNESLIKKVEKLECTLMKTELAKGKLEELCREMQRIQRKSTEEHVEKLRILEKSREEMVIQFKESMASIQKSMEEGRQTSEKLTCDNANLAEKLKKLSTDCESRVALLSRQFDEKSDYCEKLIAARDMEVELYKAKLNAASLDIQKLTQEKLQLQNDLLARELRMKEALEAEKEMREQINKYSKKYNELHNSLNNSNETFDKFKREMERMNTNLIKVEKESRRWKTKHEDLSKILAITVDEKKKIEDESAHKDRQLQQLQILCRTLKSQIPNE